MMTQQIYQDANRVPESTSNNLESKVEELSRSISEVYKYELLTTNQYLKQMELVLEIFNDISNILATQ
jgi:hypothetical protein